MGCDIHIAMELLSHKDEWIDFNMYEVNPYYDSDEKHEPMFRRLDPYTGRNYELFTALAGVRQRGHGLPVISDPRGLPRDCSYYIKADSDAWGVDGHSHSYVLFSEILQYAENYKTVNRSGMITPEQMEDLRKGKKPESWCQWTSSKDYVKAEWKDDLNCFKYFIQEVKLYIKTKTQWSHHYEKVISEPERLRFIFWFDN